MPYTRPGVYVTESPLRTTVPIPDTTATTALIGEADRGPTSPLLVTSWSQFQTAFGGLSATSNLGYAVYHFFANGGRVAYVTRVNASNASTATSASVPIQLTGSSVSTPMFSLRASSVGTWGNNLTAVLTSSSNVTASSTTFPTFNLSVLYAGSEVEYWSDLSPDPTSNRYVYSMLNEYSSYVSASVPATVLTPTSNTTYNFAASYALTGGSNGSTITSSDYVTALSRLDDISGSLLINAPGITDSTYVIAALNKAAARGNAFVIIDPDPTATSSSAISSVVNSYAGAGTNRGYGAVYYPMLKMLDPIRSGPAAIRSTHPGGAIAGVFSRVDSQRGVHKTPAGYDVEIRNALGLTTAVSDSLVDALYDTSGVNFLRTIPGAGVVVLGGRTLNKTKPDKFISVRRSLNYVKQTVQELSRDAIFEPNGPELWGTLQSRITKFLTTFWAQGGLKGGSAAQAFYVVCDSTNNTPTTIENGEVRVEVGLALQYPAEFIVINISQWTGGSNTAENLF